MNTDYTIELPFLQYDKSALVSYMKEKSVWVSEGYANRYFRPKENIPRMFLDKFYGFQYDEVETDDEGTDVDETKVQR